MLGARRSIPIVAPFEATLHIASLLGERFGIIVYSDRRVPNGYRKIIRYGSGGSLGNDLSDIAKDKERHVEIFLAGQCCQRKCVVVKCAAP